MSCGAHLHEHAFHLGGKLCAAATSGNVTRIRSFRIAGADLNQPDNSGRTAFHFAALHNRHNVIRYLLDEGIQADCLDMLGHTPRDLAKLVGATESLNLLSIDRFHRPESFAKWKSILSPQLSYDILSWCTLVSDGEWCDCRLSRCVHSNNSNRRDTVGHHTKKCPKHNLAIKSCNKRNQWTILAIMYALEHLFTLHVTWLRLVILQTRKNKLSPFLFHFKPLQYCIITKPIKTTTKNVTTIFRWIEHTVLDIFIKFIEQIVEDVCSWDWAFIVDT